MTGGRRVATLGAALVGGAAGAAATSNPPIGFALLLAVAVAALVLVAAELVAPAPVTRTRPEPPARPVLSPPPDRSWVGQDWWVAPPEPRARQQRVLAPTRLTDLIAAEAPGRLYQCPHCGAFEIDGLARGRRHLFTCQACAYSWTWQQDDPWPPVRVNPRVRR